MKKLVFILFCSLALTACSSKTISKTTNTETSTITATLPQSISYDENDLNVTFDTNNSTLITFDGTSASVQGEGASFTKDTLTISQGGTYVLSGTLNDGQVAISAPEDDIVHLVLNGAKLTNQDGAAIVISQSNKTIITLAENTENVISDGENYADISDDSPNAAIYSDTDLTINGLGSLSVTGLYNNALVSKDDLKIVSGTITIISKDDGILGRDMLAIKDGTISITAGGDGLRSTNTDDDKGYIYIENGNVTVNAGNDGIQAATSVIIENGTLNVVTGGGSKNAVVKTENGDRETTEDSVSQKGIKAGAYAVVRGGSLLVDTVDDAIHSNGEVQITDGKLSLTSGDDAIHADTILTISGGTVDVRSSYEGLEGTSIVISDGDISIVASDDGINVNENGSGTLTISGGNVKVKADGDGLDSNGSIVMTGGNVIVEGPTQSMNGSLDYDGSFDISGGTLIASGSSGMLQATSDTSTQHSFVMTFSESQKAGTSIQVKDASGSEFITITPSKEFQSIFISSPNLKNGESYVLYADDEKLIEFTLSKIVTWLNESGETAAVSGMGGMGRPNGGAQTPPDRSNERK